MKSVLIILLLSFSLPLIAKTKVVFTEQPDPKKLPILYILNDFKKPNKKLIEINVTS